MSLLIKDFKEGFEIEEQFIVSSVTKSTSSSGKLYFRVTLKDSSGSINAVKWNILESDQENFQVGNIILVRGHVDTYKSALQMDIEEVHAVSDEDIDIDRFVKESPIPQEKLLNTLDDFVASIKDQELHLLVETIIKNNYEKIKFYPAAVSVHHDFNCGLLCHTLSMAKIADYMANHYPHVNRDLLITGVLLHDIGKTIELEGKTGYHYSLEGKLLGHISIMVQIIDETAKELHLDDEKILLVKHMILSHHGEYEFGSPVLPQTREAILLNLIDNLDAKMAVVDKALEDVKPGELSQKVFALDGRILYKAKDDEN